MKRTELKRKTPLKPGKGFKKKGGALRKTQKGFNSTISPSPVRKNQTSKTGQLKARNSMKGAGRSASDIAFHGELVDNGCIACAVGGLETLHPLQIHHPRGRNKGREGDVSEKYAMCLCAEHHDQRIYSGYWSGSQFVPVRDDVPSVHKSKRIFISAYGTEDWLVHESYRAIGATPEWLSNLEWESYCLIGDKNEQESYLIEVTSAISMKERRQKLA